MSSRVFLAAAFMGLFLAGCDVRPKNVPCSNAGDCEAAGNQFRYCLESRCVECLGDSSCGEGNRCKSGLCERHCRDGRDCKSGETCKEHICDG